MARAPKPKQSHTVGIVLIAALLLLSILPIYAMIVSGKAGVDDAPSGVNSDGAGASSSQKGQSAAQSGGQSATQSSAQKPQSKPAASSQSAASGSASDSAASDSGALEAPTPSAGPNGTYLLNNEDEIRAAAFAQLNGDEQKAVGENWKTAQIFTRTLQGAMGSINNMDYIGKQVYSVNFVCRDAKRIPPEIGVFLAQDTGKLIGYGYYE